MTDTHQGGGVQGPKEDAKAEPRIAVVFIHGQGEQRPMEDVQELARTVWAGDPTRTRKDGNAPHVWLTPDESLGLADLGRVTTEARAHDIRVDFYELYWAHLMSGNKLSHLADWFRALQKRPRRDAPPTLLPVRQTVIRFIESLSLLAMLFVAMAAFLTPPSHNGLSRDSVEAAFSAMTFDLAPSWMVARAIGPDDLVWILGLVFIVLLGAAIVSLLINELRNGATVRGKISDPKKLKARGQRLKLLNRGLTVALGVGTIGFLIAMILQGPFAEWADARVLLLAAAALSALFLAVRHLEASITTAIAASSVALVVALFGGAGTSTGIIVSERTVPPAGLFVPNAHGAGFMLDAALTELVAFAAMMTAIFAVLWFCFGLLRGVSAAKHWFVRFFWFAVLAALSIGVTFAAFSFGMADKPFHWTMYGLGLTIAVVVGVASVMFVLASRAFLVPVMADSARYFSRDPSHVRARQNIRQAGINLLERLHQRPPSEGGYSRVIVVAHSLGSAVGYELLIDYWGRKAGDLVIADNSALKEAIDALEKAAFALNTADRQRHAAAFTNYRNAQTDLQRALLVYSASTRAKRGAPNSGQDGERPQLLQTEKDLQQSPRHWLITDFITLGSPLTHASLLLAESPDALSKKFEARTLSSCPPMLFTSTGQALSHRTPKGAPAPQTPSADAGVTFVGYDMARRFAHHACFAPVRWTNHFFPTQKWIAEGDVIGGPLAPFPSPTSPSDHGVMGRGVLDKELDRSHTGALFAHNEYWRSSMETDPLRARLAMQPAWPMHIKELIASLNLDEELPRGHQN